MLDATRLLRLYASFRKRQLDALPADVRQETVLLALVKRAQSTSFGKQHDFASIGSVEDFQRKVPLRSYEKFWDEYWKPAFPRLTDCTWPGTVPFYAVSSGTTSGKTKYIPYTAEMRSSNTKAGIDLLVHHVSNRPASRIFGGKSFILGGSTALVEEAPGIWSGDLSGITVKTMPWWIRPFYFPRADLALLKDWEEKVERLASASLTEDIRLFSGVPSWMLIFLKRAFEIAGGKKQGTGSIYPNLEMVVHGGVNFAPYYPQFKEMIEGSRAELREVYPASEGFIALADRGYGDGLRLICDHGIFFEFVPVDELTNPQPTRHWVKTVEKDVNYAVVLTTCAGLWSYILGDTVKFVETATPRLLVTGRTSYFLSAFGEHLTGEEIEQAVSHAAGETSQTVSDYSIGAIYPAKPGDLGGHLMVIEFASPPSGQDSINKFQESFTRRLCELNDDYDAHYAKGFGLKAAVIKPVPPGFFAAWMKSRGKLGGQHKVPRIISDPELLQNLKLFAEEYRP